jgi:hypothetical protein
VGCGWPAAGTLQVVVDHTGAVVSVASAIRAAQELIAEPVHDAATPRATEVGHDYQGDRAVLAAHRAVELDFGGGIVKWYLLKANLLG